MCSCTTLRCPCGQRRRCGWWCAPRQLTRRVVHEVMEVLREQRRELEKMDTMVDDLAATGRLTPALMLTAAKAYNR
jgi:hypothetical protein